MLSFLTDSVCHYQLSNRNAGKIKYAIYSTIQYSARLNDSVCCHFKLIQFAINSYRIGMLTRLNMLFTQRYSIPPKLKMYKADNSKMRYAVITQRFIVSLFSYSMIQNAGITQRLSMQALLHLEYRRLHRHDSDDSVC